MGVGEEGSWELGVGGWGRRDRRTCKLSPQHSLPTQHSALRTPLSTVFPLGTRNSELCTPFPTAELLPSRLRPRRGGCLGG
uniref:Uncharacterized protein n=1 Tax=Desertifilum tharense IPPAS B-1220 TaxID=1781255 RepID=A0ACD5H0D1_9CYAN